MPTLNKRFPCPICGDERPETIQSRSNGEYRIRRYKWGCGHRATSIEMLVPGTETSQAHQFDTSLMPTHFLRSASDFALIEELRRRLEVRAEPSFEEYLEGVVEDGVSALLKKQAL